MNMFLYVDIYKTVGKYRELEDMLNAHWRNKGSDPYWYVLDCMQGKLAVLVWTDLNKWIINDKPHTSKYVLFAIDTVMLFNYLLWRLKGNPSLFKSDAGTSVTTQVNCSASLHRSTVTWEFTGTWSE